MLVGDREASQRRELCHWISNSSPVSAWLTHEKRARLEWVLIVRISAYIKERLRECQVYYQALGPEPFALESE